MKRKFFNYRSFVFFIFFCGVSVFSGSFLFAGPTAWALDFVANDTVNVTQPAKDDLYILGGEVTVEQKVSGDLIVIGGNVSVFGDVSGDIFILGGDVSIHGNVGDDVRIFSGNVSVKGNVSDDIVAIAGNILIERGATIGGTVFVKGGMVTVDGNVHENIMAMTSVLRVRGWVDGNIEAYARHLLSLSSSARVNGSLKYFSRNPAVIPDGVVRGTVEKTSSILGGTDYLVLGFLSLGTLFGKLFFYLSLLLMALFLTIFLPEFLPYIAEDMRENFWKRLATGFVGILVIPATAFLFALTVIGLPIAFILIVGLFVMWFFVQISVGFFVGNLFFRKPSLLKWRMYGRFSLGLFVYFLVSLIPVFGFVLATFLSLLALGSFLVERYQMLKFLKAKKFW